VAEFTLKIVNIVASAALPHRLDLASIAKSLHWAKYRPKRFPAVILKLKEPKVSLLVFSSGKIICSGAKSEAMIIKAIRKIIREFKNKGIIIRGPPTITIQNIVATADLGGQVQLDEACHILRSAIYEPEQFPALIYRMDDPKVVFLIYANGKTVCTGAKKEEHTYQAVERLKMKLKKENLLHPASINYAGTQATRGA